MASFRWTASFQPQGWDGPALKIEINSGEALRFSRWSSAAFDERGLPVSRFDLEHEGLDEFFAYHFQREAVPRPRQVFVLCARVEGNSYAVSTSFDPFDPALVSGPAAAGLRKLMDAYLGRRFHRIDETVLYECLVRLFAREDCLEDRRDYMLAELWGMRRGRKRLLFKLDPSQGWTAPWSRIELPLSPAMGVELHFVVLQHRLRIYVDRCEEEESVPAVGVPVRVELPDYKGGARLLSAETDSDGRALIRIRRLGNKLSKRFTIGREGEEGAPAVGGHLLVRPPSSSQARDAAGPRSFGSPGLPGPPGSRSTPSDLSRLLLDDLAACHDPDVDNFTDPLSGEPSLPTFERASLLSSAYSKAERPPEVKRFFEAALRRVRSAPEKAGRLERALVLGIDDKSLAAAFDERLAMWAERPSRIWTADDCRFVRDGALMLATGPSRARRRRRGGRGPGADRTAAPPAGEGACKGGRIEDGEARRMDGLSAYEALVRAFTARLAAELEPTFYVRQLKRPVKTYCASTSPVEPHAHAIIALLAARGISPELVDDALVVEQAEHICSMHGFYDSIPDIVAHGRKGYVDFDPLLSGAWAFSLLPSCGFTGGESGKRLEGYATEIFARYREHYDRLTLAQRFDMLAFALPGLAPWFDAEGRLIRWRRGRRLS